MVKNLKTFIEQYKWLSVVIVVAVIGIILSIIGFGDSAYYILSAFSLLMATRLAIGMVQTIKDGRYGIDILAVMAIVSTVVVGEYWAAIVIVLMLTSGEALEDYAAKRAKKELNALLDNAPHTARRISKYGKSEQIALSYITVGDKIEIRPGEVVPVDATLIDAVAEFDESSLTGESLPVERKKGDDILSGSINGSRIIYATVKRTAKESQYQKIIELVKAAADSEAPFVRLADRYAIPFTIISLIIAGIAWAVSGEALRFAQVLVVATPCPLLLGAPIALISGMSRAAKNGIIIKSGTILERLSDIKAVAFDKTGTLTYGQPKVKKVVTSNGFTKEDIIRYAASVEAKSVHTLAHAIVEYSASLSIALQHATHVKEVIAQGLTAKINNRNIVVGKKAFVLENGATIGDNDSIIGETAVFVSVNNVYAGHIIFHDQARDDSKEVIRELYTLGIHKTIMLTGDGQATAARISQEVGISDFRAECLPIDKVEAIKNIHTRPILMVGDGVNDAPVLAVADVGMAMGARGSTAATETADVVVMVDDISKVSQAIRIAKQTFRIALQSIWIGIAISVLLMLVASTGVIPAVVGAALQEVVDVVVIINALRAHGPWKITTAITAKAG